MKSFAESEKGYRRGTGEEISQKEEKQEPLLDEKPRGATRQAQVDARCKAFGRKVLLD